MLQRLKPAHLKPVLHNKRRHCNEKPVQRNEEQPPLTVIRKKPHSNKDTAQPKRKKENCFCFCFFKNPSLERHSLAMGCRFCTGWGAFVTSRTSFPTVKMMHWTWSLRPTDVKIIFQLPSWALHSVQLSSVIWLSHR